MRKIGLFFLCLVLVLLAYFLWLFSDDMVRCRNGIEWLLFLFIATPTVYPWVGIILIAATALLFSLMSRECRNQKRALASVLIALGLVGGLASGLYFENWEAYRPRCSIGF